jgi:hypothetical protein
MPQQQQKSSSETAAALQRCQEARDRWLAATTEEDLDQVETLYKSALNATSSGGGGSDRVGSSKRQRKHYAELSPSEYRQAGERLSLLYCQSGRAAKAKKGLAYLEFECRLATEVLDYPFKTKQKKKKVTASTSTPPCMILDDFLHPTELKHLQGIFENPSASYWTEHKYRVEPPSPYFSFVMDLRSTAPKGFLGRLAHQIRQLPQLQAKFPQLAQTHFVELWAHNRPHASGHQLHFDSDDEGRGGDIRNPVCSTILYLTSDDKNATGGPSLVTNQRLSSKHLATKGWLAHPKSRRLVVFDGSVLHGVIPGKGVNSGRRVTLMMAFWKHIQIRDEKSPGSARPFPSTANKKKKLPPWAAADLMDTAHVSKERPATLSEAPPIPLSTVYETLEGDPWKSQMGMPDYEQVFQGF